MSSVFTLFFEPLDVLHFREPRPWDAGLHVLSRSSFPTPGSLRGALRSALLSQVGADFGSQDQYYGVKEVWAQKLLGGRSDPGLVTVRGPLIAVSPDLHKSASATRQKPLPLFPPPQDLVFTEKSKKQSSEQSACVRRLRLRDLATIPEKVAPTRWHFGNNQLASAAGSQLPWTSEELVKESLAGQYLVTAAGVDRYRSHAGTDDLVLAKAKSLADYLARHVQNQADPVSLLQRNAVYQVESRIGIAREPDSLTVQEGMFYLALSFRFARGAGLAIEVDATPDGVTAEEGAAMTAALRDLHGRVIQLGGRGHRARIHVSEGNLIDPLDSRLSMNSQAETPSPRSVWLITPLLWPAGQQERPADLLTFISDRPQVIGGFDQAQRCPKPLRFALPAGSVLFLRDGASWESVRSGLCASTWAEDRCLGYGTALLNP